MQSSALTWIFTGVLALAALYAFYAGAKKYTDFKKESKTFMQAHPKAEMKSFSNWLFWLEAAGGLLGFVLALILPSAASTAEEAWSTRILYIVLGLMMFAMALDTYVHHRVIIGEDGFFYEGTYTRFRSILKLEPSTGFFKPCQVTVTNSEVLVLHKEVGVAVENAYKEWKAAKKAKRARRK